MVKKIKPGLLGTVLKKLDEELQNELLYLSLFDPSGWELGYPSMKETDVKKQLINILKSKKMGNFRIPFKNCSHEEQKSFIKSFFYSGDAVNHIISNYIKRGTVRVSPQPKHGGFDLEVKVKGDHSGCIGIKRLLSTNNILDELNDHNDMIKKCGERSDKCKHMFLCLFPLLPKEELYRVKRLLIGYQSIIPCKIPKGIRENTVSYFLPVDQKGRTGERYALKHIEELIKLHIKTKE